MNRKVGRIRNLREYRKWIMSGNKNKKKSHSGLCNKKFRLMNGNKINDVVDNECDELRSQKQIVIESKYKPNREIRNCDHKKSLNTQIQNKPMVKQENEDIIKEEKKIERKRPKVKEIWILRPHSIPKIKQTTPLLIPKIQPNQSMKKIMNIKKNEFKRPRKTCNICGFSVSKSNFKRHLDKAHPGGWHS